MGVAVVEESLAVVGPFAEQSAVSREVQGHRWHWTGSRRDNVIEPFVLEPKSTSEASVEENISVISSSSSSF